MGSVGRGALYMVWGEAAEREAQASAASLSLSNPGLAYTIHRMPEGSCLLDKAEMFDISPYEETVFLDSDTRILGDLSFGFERAREYGIACCICECPWASRYPSIAGDCIEYNTGVLFFDKRHAGAERVFYAWQDYAGAVDSSITWDCGGRTLRMPYNDQAGFALAVEAEKFNPFVLPMNWNFRPQWHRTWFGGLKVWHGRHDVPVEITNALHFARPMDFFETRLNANKER